MAGVEAEWRSHILTTEGVAMMFDIDPVVLAFQLSFFAGFLLYLGASDLLPHVHEHPRAALLASTLAGLVTAGAIVFALSKLHGV